MTFEPTSRRFTLVLDSNKSVDLSKIIEVVQSQGKDMGAAYRVVWGGKLLDVDSPLDLKWEGVLPVLGGGEIKWSEFVGRKPMLIAFWASWCRPCLDESVFLRRFHSDYGKDVEFISVSIDEAQNHDVLSRLVQKLGVSYTVALDPEAVYLQSLGIKAIPFTVVVSEEGELLYRDNNFLPGDEKFIEEALLRAGAKRLGNR